jgi:hypothetical protein
MSGIGNRRDFLKYSGLAAGGVALLSPRASIAKAIVKSFLQSAQSEAQNMVSPRYYVSLALNGAPLRHQFDHWLRTNASDPEITICSSSATAFTYDGNGSITGYENRTMAANNGMLVPHVFSTFTAADRSAFLDNFLVIRGYGSGRDGHPFNLNMQRLPLDGTNSIAGLIADYSDRYFKAIDYGSGGPYNSQNGVGRNALTGTQTPLSTLLAPITNANSARSLRMANQDVISDLRNALRQYDSSNQAARVAKASLDSAYVLLNQGVPDYESEWPSLVNEYLSLMTTAVRDPNFPGIRSSLDGSRALSMMAPAEGYNLRATSDLFSIPPNKNIANIANEMDMTVLARSFALADFCIRYNYISSLELSGGTPTSIRRDPDQPLSPTNSVELDPDSHNAAGMPLTFINSIYYRGMITGLMQFRNRMIGSGKWNQVVVHTLSDFGRSLFTNEFGSDHAFNGMCSSIFSGVLSGGPYVVGNIARGAGGINATQPDGAIISSFDPSAIPTTLTNASSITQLLSVPRNPWGGISAPLFTLNSDGTLNLPYGSGVVVR